MIFTVNRKDNKLTGLEKIREFFIGAKDGQYSIKIEKWKKTRTLQQNNYLWLYYKIISDDTGDNINDLHEFFKRKLLPPRFVIVMKREVKLPTTTTNLSKSEFSLYIKGIEELTGILAPETERYLYG